MLKAKHSHGVTLIELIIGIAILSLLIALAVPNFSNMIGNMKIRNAAESIASGLQIARANALKGNALTHFQLMDGLDNSCGLDKEGTSWVVSRDEAAGKCGIAPSETVAPFIVQKHDGKESGGRVKIVAGENTYTFNGLGRLAITSTAGSIAVYGAEGENACVKNGGSARCLQINVASGGNIRMCDPALTDATDTRKC